MTRICSQLTNSKLPLQGQKNVEVKEEKNDEKNLYRDISTFYHFFENKFFRVIDNFEELAISKARLFHWSTFSGNRLFQQNNFFRPIDNFEKLSTSKTSFCMIDNFGKSFFFDKTTFSSLYFSDARSCSTTVQSSANNR